MKIEFDFEVNSDLRDAFYASIEDIRNGSYNCNDIASYNAQLDEICQKNPEDWSEETKKRFDCFSTFPCWVSKRAWLALRRF